MYGKICDNCNELAAIEDQKCIELKLPYDNVTRHFCNKECLNEFLNKKEEVDILLEEVKDKVIELLGNEKIDKINELVNDVDKDKLPSERYSSRILRGELINRVLRDIIRDDG